MFTNLQTILLLGSFDIPVLTYEYVIREVQLSPFKHFHDGIL
jgi:hypothetical protein